ncbi:hypothetical protein SDC9_77959 [bioreactor metagenome]|uniref:Acyltransferase 3 domain-containing protein n=1 Tax=bioreactor metagenome TaxID=1076179 RepID=A0A644YZM6_9ZZZZ
MAAIWVAIFHGALVGLFPNESSLVKSFVDIGYAGVDVFFVISGVIMAHSTKNIPSKSFTAGAFFLTRFSRIYSGWWPVMLFYVIFFEMTNQLGPQVNLLASFFLYFKNPAQLINVATWSLMFELYFYTIISISLLFKRQYRQYFLILLFTFLLLINIYLFIIRPTESVASEINWIQIFYIAPIVAEFFMGYFLYQYIQKNPRASCKIWGAIALILIFLTAYLAPHFLDRPNGLAGFYYWPERTVLIGGISMTIVGMALKLPSPQKNIALILTKFGSYSYSIYLLHILAFNMIFTLLPWSSFNNNYRIVISVATMAVLLLASAVYYHCVEHPVYIFLCNKINRIMSRANQ